MSKSCDFFGLLQQFFVLISSSTPWWSILKDKLGISLYSQSDTRWSSLADAVRPVAKQLIKESTCFGSTYTKCNYAKKANIFEWKIEYFIIFHGTPAKLKK